MLDGESTMTEQATGDSAVVRVAGVVRRFGTRMALDGASLTVPRGGVFGLIGVNGSGKTTLIKHILGLLRPQAGTVRVFGVDPVAEPVAVLKRIGYLSEDNDLPGWMRVGELLRYMAAFYPDWDAAFAEELRQRFGLDPGVRVGGLSRGQKARAGLVTALAHRPELLVLDEPSSGLDPLVRRDILVAVVRTVADEGRTVLFSSHLLDEVERVADRVAILNAGRVVYSAAVEEFAERHRRLTLRFAEARQTPPDLPGALAWEGGGLEWTAVCRGEPDALRSGAGRLGARVVEEHVPRLDEVFAAQVAAQAEG
jgi:ABC-2 type transport system ATP-binding protein